jgi:hypothetical protein
MKNDNTQSSTAVFIKFFTNYDANPAENSLNYFLNSVRYRQAPSCHKLPVFLYFKLVVFFGRRSIDFSSAFPNPFLYLGPVCFPYG